MYDLKASDSQYKDDELSNSVKALGITHLTYSPPNKILFFKCYGHTFSY